MNQIIIDYMLACPDPDAALILAGRELDATWPLKPPGVPSIRRATTSSFSQDECAMPGWPIRSIPT